MRRGYRKSYGAYSVRRSSRAKNPESTTALRIVRAVVLLLLLGVIIGTITVAVNSFRVEERQNRTLAVAQADNSEELLRVVNKTNPVDKDFVPELVGHDGYSVSTLADEPLNVLLEAAREEGLDLSVDYAYVSYSEQEKLYDAHYKSVRKSGKLSEVKAQAKAERVVPRAGRSEFQTGLLVSFKTDKSKFSGSAAAKWLERKCVDYGFVLRYPRGKTGVTNMDYNACAYRYVGVENAAVMRSLGKTLEEYSLYVGAR